MNKALAIASLPNVTLVSYGDMLRVPGSSTDLFHIKANGGDVRIAYSPMEALKIARANPTRQVVFLGIGFETTAPANAMAVWKAAQDGVRNFSMLASQVLVPPAIRMLLESPHHRVQGFIAPGHVCTVMGYERYLDLSRDFSVPIVVGGFEPVDLLEAISMLVAQLEAGRAEVENQYVRTVSAERESARPTVMAKVFEVCDRKWRGIGMIPRSGLGLRAEFAAFDAEKIFDVAAQNTEEPTKIHQCRSAPGIEEAPGLPGFRRSLHSRESARGAHGFVGRRLRGILPIQVPQSAVRSQDSAEV